MSLSVIVITKNEERNIAACLESVRWADELVVVDACSEDRTTELARAGGATVFVRKWPGFGPQKNFGMEQARSEWLLILDADERVSASLRDEIIQCIDRWTLDAPSAYRMPRCNYFYGAWVRWGGVFPDYQIRLLRKGRARYNDAAVHENLVVEGNVGTLSTPLDHFTERRVKDHFKKFGLYTSLAAQEKGRIRVHVRPSDLLIRPLVVFVKTYLFKQGFRDGVRGLIVCAFASMYTFVKYAKLWDLTRQGIAPLNTSS